MNELNRASARDDEVPTRWVIRASSSEDLKAIDELFATVFWYRPPGHSIWKFAENPAGSGIGMVAVDSGRIVGQYVLMPTKLRLGREVVLGAQSLDTMTHPDYRRQGMFLTLTKACTELAAKRGVEVLYGFPGPNTYQAFIQRLNWNHVSNIPVWVRIIRPEALSPIPNVLKPIGALGVRARARMLPKGNSSPRGIEVRLGCPSEKNVESLLEDWRKSEGTCRVDRSIEWFRWRFDPASQTDYRWAVAYRDGNARAWAVWGIRQWGNHTAMIDLLGCDCEALEAATSTAVRQAIKTDVPRLLAITNEPVHIRALKSCGFIQHGTVPLIVRSMTSRNLDGNIHDQSSWRIHTADADTF